MTPTEELIVVRKTTFSAEYLANERRIEEAHDVFRRIAEDRRLHGRDDPEREIAFARAEGTLYGYLFRDAELYHEETGIPIPRKR